MKAKLVEDYLKQHFQIFKNNNKSEYYNYIVLKGDELYNVRIEPGQPMQWKYVSRIHKPTYSINGNLVKTPSKEMIYIMQNVLKPISAIGEVQHFERGLDPKKAMNTGIRSMRMQQYQELEKAFEKEFPNFLKDGIIELNRWSGNVPFLQVKSSIFVKGTWLNGERAKPAINKWLKKKFPDFRVTSLRDCGMFSGMDYSMELKWKYDGVNEAQNFERGIDPKDAMGIGKASVSEEEIDDYIIDLAQDLGGAFELYLPYEEREQLYWISKTLGNKKIKIVSFELDDAPQKLADEDDREKVEYLYNKKVKPWIDKGWEEFHVEDNYETMEYILIKKL